MRRFPILGSLFLIPAVTMLVMTGCGGGGDKTTPTKTTGGSKGKTPPTQTTKITAALEGTVTGKVVFDGTAAAPASLAGVMGKHSDKDTCLMGASIDQKWIVDKNGNVANVVVSLMPESGKAFDVTDALKEKWKKKVTYIDQPFCAYEPRVAAVLAGVQPFEFRNSAKIGHSVKVAGGEDNGDTNDKILPSTKPKQRTFNSTSKPIRVSCADHTWMEAYVVTFDHPYFAVTKADGTFEIGDVPVGEKLHVYLWHESFDAPKDSLVVVTAEKGKKTTAEGLKVK